MLGIASDVLNSSHRVRRRTFSNFLRRRVLEANLRRESSVVPQVERCRTLRLTASASCLHDFWSTCCCREYKLLQLWSSLSVSLFSGTRSYWKRRGFHAFHNEKSRQTGKYLHTNCSGTQLLRQPKDRGIPDSEELTEKGQFYHFLLSLTFTINTAFVRL